MISKEVKGRLRKYLWWPLFLLPIFAALGYVAFRTSSEHRVLLLICLIAYALFLLIWFLFAKNKFQSSIIEYSQGIINLQKEEASKSTIPIAIFEENKTLLWANDAFYEVFGDKIECTKDISKELSMLFGASKFEGPRRSGNIICDKSHYQVELNELGDGGEFALSFIDITELSEAKDTIRDLQPAMLQVLIDNYDEIISNIEELDSQIVVGYLARCISEYFLGKGAIAIRVERDRFVVRTDFKTVDAIRKEGFSIVESIKKESVNGATATVSIGVGLGGSKESENNAKAKNALSLALSRGGDQVVIQDGDKYEFLGGKAEAHESGNKVQTRHFAGNFKKYIMQRDEVLIMGHKYPDADSFGAAIGVHRIARSLGKKAHIVIDEVPSVIGELYNLVASKIEEDAFVDIDTAKSMMTKNTALVLVDVNKSSITECPELLGLANQIAIIDHHREGSDSAKKENDISCILSTASSASEIVVEITEYIGEKIDYSETEATALYAGIVIDTDNFLAKTGTRTFQAAAFLREKGANILGVRKIFRESMEEFKTKAEIISSIEIFEGSFAFGICDAEGVASPTIVGARAANDLLDIEGIKASFVFTKHKDKIFVSARAIDEVNVQFIMEKIGGGGHFSIAGAQLDCTLSEATDLVKKTISEMLEEGAI